MVDLLDVAGTSPTGNSHGAGPSTSDVHVRFRAMASDVTIWLPGRAGDARAIDAVARATRVVGDVGRECSRFDPESSLSKANARPDRWHRVTPRCFSAIEAAHSAYASTKGRFDPRVLDDLVALGYDRSFELLGGAGAAPAGRARRPHRPAATAWRPRFHGADHAVHLDGARVDLGGIGKGLALRWAADVLRPVACDFLLEAGGDCSLHGRAPDGGDWKVGVEDPFGGAAPVAVLAGRDCAITTSSTRLRRWSAGGVAAHHLIDPRTGLPGGEGLAAVTVAGADPARSEVLSKTLFLAGADAVAREARRGAVAALWVRTDGSVAWSPAMAPLVEWSAT